jgi:hypothetical protein
VTAAERKRAVGQRALAIALGLASAVTLATADPARAQPTDPPAQSAQTQTGPETTPEATPEATSIQQQDDPPGHEWLPSKPFTFFHGRLVVSGDATITYGTHDFGYFDTQDYYHDAFSVMRLGLTAKFRVNDHLSVLGQVLDDVALRGDDKVDVDRQVFRVYALFVRVRPWTSHAFDVQAGRIPPVFGAFARQSYGTGNPLIGVPLAYQYQTSLRGDALPASQTALLNWRGAGWSVRYTPSVGPRNFEPGMPIISLQQWDTGVQAHWGAYTSPVNVSVSVTNGTLSYPQTDDNNDGKQVAARVAFRPETGLVIGVSGARGEFLDHSIDTELPPGSRHDPYTQTTFGVDAEYSRGYWLVRGESILTRWRVPDVGPEPPLRDPLGAWASFVEATWRFAPRWYLAARAEHLGFSRTDTASYQLVPWDAPVTRGEAGFGYTFTRNIRGKLTYQQNWREARRRREGIAGVQLLYWF